MYDFKQQKCWSCMAIMRPSVLAFCLLMLAVLCLSLGIVWIVFASLAKETATFRYDNLCELHHKCTFRFEVEEDMKAPVYLYYRIEGFYQGYRRYFASQSNGQLQGKNANTFSKLGGCSPRISEGGDISDPSAVYLPCGLIATSYFNGKESS